MNLVKKLLLTSLVLLAFAFSDVSAQQVFKTTSKSVIAYYEYVPDNYNANSDKYPVVIFLHGLYERGPNSTDPNVLKNYIYKVAKLGPPMYVKNGTDFPFILISPQLKSNYGLWPSTYVMEVIEHVKSYLRIDERRIYVTGLSLGGGGTWVTAQDFARQLAAVAPVCGGYNSTAKAPNIAKENLPVWGFHGNKDNIVNMSKTVNMVNAINGCTPKPSPLAKVTIYNGVAHDAWKYAYKTDNSMHSPNVYQWLLSHTNVANAGNKIPLSKAGVDQIKYYSTTLAFSLIGSGADTDGSIVKYEWTKISGPAVSCTGLTTAAMKLTRPAKGTYYFRLKVTDNSGNTDSDYVRVIIK